MNNLGQKLPSCYILTLGNDSIIFFPNCRSELSSQQTVSAQGNTGICPTGEICSSGPRHIHHQRLTKWTGHGATCSRSDGAYQRRKGSLGALRRSVYHDERIHIPRDLFYDGGVYGGQDTQ